MHQAQVNEWGQSPKYTEVPDLPAPGPDETRVKIQAAGLHKVVRSRAAGKHYSSGNLPHVPGVDAVGTTDDGQPVYFSSFTTGSMAEYVNVPKTSVKPLPAGTDPIQAAAVLNPALSSWMALKFRTSNLPPNFTVLIIGATSASGRVAISLARSLGAKKVIGAARNKSVLDSLDVDSSIMIAEDAGQTDFSSLGDVDVILDYVYGPVTTKLFNSLHATQPVQYVHVGGLAGLDIILPGAALRSNNLTIRGSGPGAWSMKELASSMDELLAIVKDIPEQPVTVARLAEVERSWGESSAARVVFVP